MIKSYNNDPQSINNVGLNQTMNSIKNSQYGNYDFSNGFSFKKVIIIKFFIYLFIFFFNINYIIYIILLFIY